MNVKKLTENEVLLEKSIANKIVKSPLNNSSAINILPSEKFTNDSKLDSKQNSSGKVILYDINMILIVITILKYFICSFYYIIML